MLGGFPKKLQSWVEAGLITEDQSARILNHEKIRKSGKLSRDLTNVGLFAILLGFISVIAANWQIIPPYCKLGLHALLNLGVVFGILRFDPVKHPYKRDMCVTALFVLFLTFIALIAQIYQLHGELYQTLIFWVAICTPFIWYWGRGFGAIIPWLTALLVTIFLTSINISDFKDAVPWVFLITAIYLPLTLRFGARSTFIQKTKPDFAAAFHNVGLTLPAIFASISVNFFYFTSRTFDHHHILLGIMSVGTLLTIILLRPRYAKPYSLDYWPYTIISSLLIFIPFAVPNFDYHILGAVLFILYWLYMAWFGARIHSNNLTDWAIRIVMLRLYILYLEIFGGLLTQGLSLILSGVLLILMIKYASRIVGFGRRLVTRGA